MTSIKKGFQETAEEDLQQLLKQSRNDRQTRRIQAVLLHVKNGWNREQIAQATGYAKSTIRDLQLKYLKEGSQALISNQKHAERNQYLKREQEAEFLSNFRQSALEGELVSAMDIQSAYEKLIGKKVARSTVYRLLKRNGWRKIVPRPKHPKSDARERERFKKTPKIAKETEAKSQSQWMPAQSDVPG